VDLVLCNPPYVPDGTPVSPEVAEHDPYHAVFAGPDGLAVIRRLIPRVVGLLRPGGWFGVEHDDSQAEAVPELLRAAGAFTAVADHRDLAGRPRFATARRLADFTP
jgi:release factor glutamine methyltransferase